MLLNLAYEQTQHRALIQSRVVVSLVVATQCCCSAALFKTSTQYTMIWYSFAKMFCGSITENLPRRQAPHLPQCSYGLGYASLLRRTLRNFGQLNWRNTKIIKTRCAWGSLLHMIAGSELNDLFQSFLIFFSRKPITCSELKF